MLAHKYGRHHNKYIDAQKLIFLCWWTYSFGKDFILRRKSDNPEKMVSLVKYIIDLQKV